MNNIEKSIQDPEMLHELGQRDAPYVDSAFVTPGIPGSGLITESEMRNSEMGGAYIPSGSMNIKGFVAGVQR